MKKEEILALKPLGVLVRLNAKDVVPDKVKMSSGVELEIVIRPQGEYGGEWTLCVGEAVRVNKDYPTYDWLEEGDVVYIDYGIVKQAFGHWQSDYRVMKDDDTGDLYLIVAEGERINLVVRKGEIVAPPNMTILSRVEKEKAIETFLHIPDMVKTEKKYFHNVFKVVAVGVEDKRLNANDWNRDSIAIPEVGKTILVGMHSGLAIEPDFLETLPEPLFYCRHSEVMGYIDLE